MARLAEAKDQLANAVIRNLPEPELLDADQWIVNSLLQKSIRRGEVPVAQRAALSFLRQRGSAVWRRLIIIAFEDVGIGFPDALAMTVAAGTDASWRRQVGGDVPVVSHLARLLAEAPKSRSTEHLITSSHYHPSFEQPREQISNSSLADNLDTVRCISIGLPSMALAAWRVSGVDWKWGSSHRNSLPDLLESFRDLGVPNELVDATGIAMLKIRDPIIVMAPIIWLAIKESSGKPVNRRFDVPRSLIVHDFPMYALDKHTRIGREAIRNLVKSSPEIRECLEQHVDPSQRRDACYMAAFYADAAPLAYRLVWQRGDELERLGTEADLLKVGVPPDGMEPLLRLFRESVDQLNQIRGDTFLAKRLPGGTSGVIICAEDKA